MRRMMTLCSSSDLRELGEADLWIRLDREQLPGQVDVTIPLLCRLVVLEQRVDRLLVLGVVIERLLEVIERAHPVTEALLDHARVKEHLPGLLAVEAIEVLELDVLVDLEGGLEILVTKELTPQPEHPLEVPLIVLVGAVVIGE